MKHIGQYIIKHISLHQHADSKSVKCRIKEGKPEQYNEFKLSIILISRGT